MTYFGGGRRLISPNSHKAKQKEKVHTTLVSEVGKVGWNLGRFGVDLWPDLAQTPVEHSPWVHG